MRISKATLLFLAPLLIVSVVAFAAEKPDGHGPENMVPIAYGALAIGDDCTDPIVIDALPYSVAGATNCASGNNYFDTCLDSYDSGEDVFYQFTLDAATYIDVTLDPLGTAWAGIAILDACPPAAECVAFATNSFNSTPFGLTGVELTAHSDGCATD